MAIKSYERQLQILDRVSRTKTLGAMALLKAIALGHDAEAGGLKEKIADLTAEEDRVIGILQKTWLTDFSEIQGKLVAKNEELRVATEQLGDAALVLSKITEVISIIEEVTVIAAGIVI